MNDYFNPSGAPSSKSSLSSSVMRSEITNIGAGFEKLPDLTGNNNLPVAINSGGSGIEAKTAAAFRTLIEVLSEDQITALITALNLGTASTNDTEDFATAAQGAKADAAATATSVSAMDTAYKAADTVVQGNLDDHESATGTSVHGLTTVATSTLTTSTTDTNSGRITKVNDYGIPNNTGTVVYGRSNVVGTVSQSGGVPTGAIVESGSGTNGFYVRYADGTQICRHIVSTVTTSSSIIEGYVSSPTTWTYPKAFSAEPVVVATGETISRYCWMMTYSVSTTNVGYRGMSGFVDGQIKPSFIAIGRWF